MTTRKSASSSAAYDFVARFQEDPDHHLAIDQVAGAAQARKVKFILKIDLHVENYKICYFVMQKENRDLYVFVPFSKNPSSSSSLFGA